MLNFGCSEATENFLPPINGKGQKYLVFSEITV